MRAHKSRRDEETTEDLDFVMRWKERPRWNERRLDEQHAKMNVYDRIMIS